MDLVISQCTHISKQHVTHKFVEMVICQLQIFKESHRLYMFSVREKFSDRTSQQ
jgi:hypothetical protein